MLNKFPERNSFSENARAISLNKLSARKCAKKFHIKNSLRISAQLFSLKYFQYKNRIRRISFLRYRISTHFLLLHLSIHYYHKKLGNTYAPFLPDLSLLYLYTLVPDQYLRYNHLLLVNYNIQTPYP